MQPKEPLSIIVGARHFFLSWVVWIKHTLPTYMWKSHFNVLHPCWGLPLVFFQFYLQNPVCISSSTYTKFPGKQYSDLISMIMEMIILYSVIRYTKKGTPVGTWLCLTVVTDYAMYCTCNFWWSLYLGLYYEPHSVLPHNLQGKLHVKLYCGSQSV